MTSPISFKISNQHVDTGNQENFLKWKAKYAQITRDIQISAIQHYLDRIFYPLAYELGLRDSCCGFKDYISPEDEQLIPVDISSPDCVLSNHLCPFSRKTAKGYFNALSRLNNKSSLRVSEWGFIIATALFFLACIFGFLAEVAPYNHNFFISIKSCQLGLGISMSSGFLIQGMNHIRRRHKLQKYRAIWNQAMNYVQSQRRTNLCKDIFSDSKDKVYFTLSSNNARGLSHYIIYLVTNSRGEREERYEFCGAEESS